MTNTSRSQDLRTVSEQALGAPVAPTMLIETHNFIVSRANTAHSRTWVRQDLNFFQFLDLFSNHRADQKKDGPAFVAGAINGSERKAAAVSSIGLLVYDVDYQQTYDQVRDILNAANVQAIMYTTYSHLKTTTYINTGKFVQWCQKNGINPQDVPMGQVLHTQETVEKYAKDSGLDVKIGKFVVQERLEQTQEGMQIALKHDPIEKFRVVIPLKVPFVFAAHGYTSGEQAQAWKRRYAGVGQKLGLNFDMACSDPSRIHYLPSHPIDHEGKEAPHRLDHLLDPRTVDGVEVPREMLDIMSYKPADLPEPRTPGAGAGSSSASGASEGSDFPLRLKRAKAKLSFERMCELAIEKLDGTQTDKGVAFPCPFPHDSADNGTKTMILPTEFGGWCIDCKGSTEHNRDTLAYVKHWLDTGALTWADIGADAEEDTPEGPAEADLYETAKLALGIPGVGSIASEAPGGGIRKHLEEKPRAEFDKLCAGLATRQKLSEEGARRAVEREIARQHMPPDTRAYADNFARINVGGKPMMVDMRAPGNGAALMDDKALAKFYAADYMKVVVHTPTGSSIKQIPRAAIFVNKHAEATRVFSDGFTFDPRRVGQLLELDCPQSLSRHAGYACRARFV